MLKSFIQLKGKHLTDNMQARTCQWEHWEELCWSGKQCQNSDKNIVQNNRVQVHSLRTVRSFWPDSLIFSHTIGHIRTKRSVSAGSVHGRAAMCWKMDRTPGNKKRMSSVLIPVLNGLLRGDYAWLVCVQLRLSDSAGREVYHEKGFHLVRVRYMNKFTIIIRHVGTGDFPFVGAEDVIMQGKCWRKEVAH